MSTKTKIKPTDIKIGKFDRERDEDSQAFFYLGTCNAGIITGEAWHKNGRSGMLLGERMTIQQYHVELGYLGCDVEFRVATRGELRRAIADAINAHLAAAE